MQHKFGFYAVKIFVICTVIFILQNVFASFTDLFVLNSSLLIQQPWTFFTYMFLHANFQHLFSNMFALLFFGSMLEKVIGSRNFLRVYFLSGVVSGFIGILFYNSIIGASGAIFGAMASLALLRPNLTVWVGYIPMPMIVALFVWGASDMLGLFVPDNVAHIGHLAGMAQGIIYTMLFLRHFKEKSEKKYKIHISEETMREWEKRYIGR